MTTQSVEVARYSYRYMAAGDGDRAVIRLYDRESRLVGTVHGVPEGSGLPDPCQEGGRCILYFRQHTILALIDMLRNEGPVYLVWGDGIDPALATAFEPVGEGELARPGPSEPVVRTNVGEG